MAGPKKKAKPVSTDDVAPEEDQAPAEVPQDAEEPEYPSEEERKGMRGHDDLGRVRPADGRWGLHKPEDESAVCRTPAASEEE